MKRRHQSPCADEGAHERAALEERARKRVADRAAGAQHGEEDHEVRHDQRDRHGRRDAARTCPAPAAPCGRRLGFGRADVRVLRTADADRSEDHAVRADAPAALRAGDVRLPARVPVAVQGLVHRRLAYPRARPRCLHTGRVRRLRRLGIVIDVIRATSTICQALASGYERVLCAAEVEDARALRGELDGVTLGGERLGLRIDGFDLGNSPAEYLEPRSPVLAMSTTNGTRAIVTAAERCDRVADRARSSTSTPSSRRRARTGRTSPSSARA